MYLTKTWSVTVGEDTFWSEKSQSICLLAYALTTHPPLVVVRMPMAYAESQLVVVRLDWWLLHAKWKIDNQTH